MDRLQAVPWSEMDNALFHFVFAPSMFVFLASTVACYCGQWIDIRLYLALKKLTNNKLLWLRNNGSTLISLFVDTFMVNSFLVLMGVFPKDKLWTLIFNSYSFKMCFVFMSTPIFYAIVLTIRSCLLTKDKDIQHYKGLGRQLQRVH